MAKMMDRSRNPSESLSDELKLKYLELKCQLEPDSVVHDLQNFIFPLEESLKICVRFDNLYGQAHLKSRTRNIDGAIRIYMRVAARDGRSSKRNTGSTWAAARRRLSRLRCWPTRWSSTSARESSTRCLRKA
jgi:hypothetical protein